MLLHLSTWPDIEERLGRSTAVVVPIGSTEQHGPTGLLGTDFLCPQIIAEAAHVSGDLLIAPPFAVGMAQHHLAFPGTISLRPSTMIAAVTDWVRSLAGHGFDRIYFLNGHGGNVATLQAAFSEIYAGSAAPGCQLRLRNWWELPGVGALITELYPQGHGSHATPSEIAVTQFAHPESARNLALTPRIAPNGPIHDAKDFRRRYPDGRMGSDPGLATPEAGERIVRLAAEGLIGEMRAFGKAGAG